MIDTAIAEEFSLFDDLLADISYIPPMPDDLLLYARDLAAAEIRTLGLRMFHMFIAERYLGLRPREAWVVGTLACAEDPDTFVLDWPHANDFRQRDRNDEIIDPDEDVSEIVEFRAAMREQEIVQARARQICSDCPLAMQCLYRDLSQWQYTKGSAADLHTGLIDDAGDKIIVEAWGDEVWGGLGYRDRLSAFNQLYFLRNRLANSIRDDAAGLLDEYGLAGELNKRREDLSMTAADREAHFVAARELFGITV